MRPAPGTYAYGGRQHGTEDDGRGGAGNGHGRGLAAQAAKAFQPTQSRDQANVALPYLVSYYGLLRSAAPSIFDVNEIARRELDWWQARRERIGPRDYGRTVAAVAALTYGKPADEPDLVAFGISRAEAMAYRDARREAITDQDWSDIEEQLRGAYERLRAGIGG